MAFFSTFTKQDKTVLLRGYFGNLNVGDEAILSVIIEKLNKKGYNNIIVASKDPSHTQRIHGVEACESGLTFSFLKAFLKSHILIEAGGNKHGFLSIIDLGLPFVAKFLGKKIYYVAVGLSPYRWKGLPLHNKKPITKYSFIKRTILFILFNYVVDFVSVRDENSKRFLEINGVNPKKIKITKDPAFELEGSSFLVNTLRKNGIDLTDPLICVIPRTFLDNDLNKLLSEKLVVLIMKLIKNLHTQVVLMNFSSEDRGLVYKIYSALPKEVKANVWTIDATSFHPREVKGFISVCKVVIGARYHSLIFAISENVPSVALVYDHKMMKLSNRYLDLQPVDNFQEEKVMKKIKEVLEGGETTG